MAQLVFGRFHNLKNPFYPARTTAGHDILNQTRKYSDLSWPFLAKPFYPGYNWDMSQAAQTDISLPPPPKPVGNYVPVIRTGDLLMTSGMLPLKDGKVACTGSVGSIDVTLEAANGAARLCVLNAVSALKAYLGDTLEPIEKVVKITGFVSSAPGFFQQPQVMNGASDCLVEIFGEVGKHARSAVGVMALPLDASVEVEVTVQLKSGF